MFLSLKIVVCFQNDRTWTCNGDSGSPLIRQTNSSCYKMIGVLHGGKSSCGNSKSFPSIFANVEHRENFEFIQQWKYSFEDLTNVLKSQEDITKVVNYTTNINPVDKTGKATLNHEEFSQVFIGRCFNKPGTSSFHNLKNYGLNCSMEVDKFSCYDGTQHILLDYRCNGKNDCLDGSDEFNCSSRIEYGNLSLLIFRLGED